MEAVKVLTSWFYLHALLSARVFILVGNGSASTDMLCRWVNKQQQYCSLFIESYGIGIGINRQQNSLCSFSTEVGKPFNSSHKYLRTFFCLLESFEPKETTLLWIMRSWEECGKHKNLISETANPNHHCHWVLISRIFAGVECRSRLWICWPLNEKRIIHISAFRFKMSPSGHYPYIQDTQRVGVNYLVQGQVVEWRGKMWLCFVWPDYQPLNSFFGQSGLNSRTPALIWSFLSMYDLLVHSITVNSAAGQWPCASVLCNTEGNPAGSFLVTLL